MPYIPVPPPHPQSNTAPEDTRQVLMYQQGNTSLQQHCTAIAQLSLQSTLTRQGKAVLQPSLTLQDSMNLAVLCMDVHPLHPLGTRSLGGMGHRP